MALELIEYEQVGPRIEVAQVSFDNLDNIRRFLGATRYTVGMPELGIGRRWVHFHDDNGYVVFITSIGAYTIAHNGWMQNIDEEILKTQYRKIEE